MPDQTFPLRKSQLWRTLFRSKMGILGFTMLAGMILVALFGPLFAPYDPYEIPKVTLGDIYQGPNIRHWLGTDDTGKDVFSAVIYGARVSLLVGFAASIIIVLLGATIGMIAGYSGGSVDVVLMRITDAILVIPSLPLMLVIIAVAGRGLTNIILVIGLLYWTYMARVVRSQVISIKERPFILRAHAIGVSPFRIATYHILPQILPVLFAEVVLDVSYAILSEASLSFLGLGDPTIISWGSMINRAFLRGAVTKGAWWYIVPPGLALAWVTLGLTFLGNALQEIFNPRLRTHHLFDEHKMVARARLAVNVDVSTEKVV